MNVCHRQNGSLQHQPSLQNQPDQIIEDTVIGVNTNTTAVLIDSKYMGVVVGDGSSVVDLSTFLFI